MTGDGPIFKFPTTSESTILLVLAVLLALLILAVLWEIIRRQMDHRRRERNEWRMVKEIADEKELSSEEWHLLRDFIERHSPKEPLRTVTVRQHFNRCVDECMDGLKGAAKAYDDMGPRLRSIRIRLGLDYIPFGQRIQTTRELYTGQQLWIGEDRDAHHDWYRVHVVAVDEAHFFAQPLSNQDGPPPIRKGSTYRFRMWREEDARYVFSAQLVSVDDASQTFGFLHDTDLQRMQSRAHYRIRYDQETVVGVLNAPVDGDITDLAKRVPVTRYRGRISSLSAGGCALVISQVLPKEILLRLTLELPDTDPIQTEGRIVATSTISGGRQLVRMAFITLDEEQRDAVARYVLHRQQPLMAPAEKAD